MRTAAILANSIAIAKAHCCERPRIVPPHSVDERLAVVTERAGECEQAGAVPRGDDAAARLADVGEPISGDSVHEQLGVFDLLAAE